MVLPRRASQRCTAQNRLIIFLYTMKGALVKFVCTSCGLRSKHLQSRCQTALRSSLREKRFKYSKCQICFFKHWHGLDEDVGHHRIHPCPSEISMLPSSHPYQPYHWTEANVQYVHRPMGLGQRRNDLANLLSWQKSFCVKRLSKPLPRL